METNDIRPGGRQRMFRVMTFIVMLMSALVGWSQHGQAQAAIDELREPFLRENGIFVIITTVPPRIAYRETVFHPIQAAVRLSPKREVNSVLLTPGFPLFGVLTDSEAAAITASPAGSASDVGGTAMTQQVVSMTGETDGGRLQQGGPLGGLSGLGLTLASAGVSAGRAANRAGRTVSTAVTGALSSFIKE